MDQQDQTPFQGQYTHAQPHPGYVNAPPAQKLPKKRIDQPAGQRFVKILASYFFMYVAHRMWLQSPDENAFWGAVGIGLAFAVSACWPTVKNPDYSKNAKA
ncbi:hypothetical protein [uncultured Roseobacter sp.]|uniref:hypothetical protein n=1 Tax=uncultured Roseobacter sp. TaxID=114847 RepID=UPI00262C6EDD|nr:hypothetical protein [uncultured Roseobacter sp.]